MTIQYGAQTVGAITGTVNFNTANIATGVKFGTVPNGARVIEAFTIVRTIFNAGTTDYFRLGFNAGGIEYTGNDIDVAVAGRQTNDFAFDYNPFAADRDVWARYVGGGAAPTAGQLQFVIMWVL